MALAVSGAAKEDLVVSLAILALHDGGVEVSSENIAALINATGNTVAPYWAPLYSKLLSGKNIDELLMKPGAGGAAPAAAAGGAAPAAAAEKKEEKKKEEEPEEEVGGAGGLFGGDDDDW